MKILVINGANMNMLGRREPDIYGKEDYAALCARIYEHAQSRGVAVECFQSNHEGAIIDAIQEADTAFDGIVINPGAYTHYSYAIHDASPPSRSTCPTSRSARSSAICPSPPPPASPRSADTGSRAILWRSICWQSSILRKNKAAACRQRYQRGYSLSEENTPFESPRERRGESPSTPDIAGL